MPEDRQIAAAIAVLTKNSMIVEGYCAQCNIVMLWTPGMIVNCPHCAGELEMNIDKGAVN